MPDEKSSFLVGDLQKIPCFKKSFMYGISSGIALGFGSFIFTSRVKRSTDIAVLTFGVTTMAYWMYCRYHWTKEYFMSQKMQSSLHEIMLKGNPTDTKDV